MTVRTRLGFLAFFSILAMALFLLLFWYAQRSSVQRLVQSEIDARLLLTARILQLKSESLQNMATDYSYWDEMYYFARKPDPEWAVLNIDAGMKTFDVSLAWVLDPSGRLLYTTSAISTERLDPFPLPAPSLSEMFKASKIPHFFILTRLGLLEISGATIHPTVDAERKTPPAGFLFWGRLWDRSYLDHLSESLKVSTELVTATSGNHEHQSFARANGDMELLHSLPGVDGRPVAWLKMKTSSHTIQAAHRQAYILTAVVVCGLTLSLSLVAMLHGRWVRKPLHLIRHCLEQNRLEALGNLPDRRDEFGDLARLISSFFAQRTQLLQTMEDHLQSQADLKRSEARFYQIFDNAPIGLIALDDTQRITHVNMATQKMTGYMRREVLFEHISLMIHPEDLGSCLLNYRAMKEGNRTFHRADVRLINKSGDILFCRQTDVAIRNDQGEFLFSVTMLEEQTEPGGSELT